MNQQELIQYLSSRTKRQSTEDAIAALSTLANIKDRLPTQEERDKLLLFPGWGPIADLFTDARLPVWQDTCRNYIQKSVPPDHLKTGQRVILNQFPTDPRLIQALWNLAIALNFRSGTIMEPGCHIGLFAELAPPIRDLKIVGVDIDPTSLAIARLLHPQHKFFLKDLTRFIYPAGAIDLVIGNLPFTDGVFYQHPKFKGQFNLASMIMLRAIELFLKPGGLVILITGTGVLDGVGTDRGFQNFRAYLDKQAVFLGAARLPMAALASAGTDVCSDILVLQKRFGKGDDRASESFIQTQAFDAIVSDKSGRPVRLNEYYLEHPEYLLGVPALDKTTGDRFALEWRGERSFLEALAQVLDDIAVMKQCELENASIS